ncbi:IBR finger domain protein [Apiospora saccharicola]|uniref:IBR finger domain protein n=1 Tax=Apiospora saccharicola TaxID=335842 RepID=A0ABR1TNV3_9PEZI
MDSAAPIGGGLLINHTSTGSQTAGTVPFHGIYNASKAALASLTEGLRLELAPFGMRVVNLVTGAVRSTSFFDNSPPATLPPGSLYNVAKDEVEKSMSDEHTAADGTEAFAWAEAVVRDLSSHTNPPPWVWRGRHATEVRLASHLPVGATDGIMRKVSGLDAVEQKIKEKGWKQE